MIRVLQLIDSLDAGGAERLSISFANKLADTIEGSFICATRSEGILKSTIADSVGYLFLQKKTAFDVKAILKLRTFIKQNNIAIIHAHATSFFLATLVKLVYPRIKIVWHDHYGNSEFLKQRPQFVLRCCSLFFSHIFAVNHLLLNWSKKNLYCKNVSYLQNFVVINASKPKTKLKGESEKRVLCLANLRPQKGHLNLFEAFKVVTEKHPDWTMHCIGKDFKDIYSQKLRAYIKDHNLSKHIFFYGSCPDVNHILSQCNIGVLASNSEGLPISLLEYGMGKLAVVATDVGDCRLVIDSSDKGLIVKPENAKAMSNALIKYIDNKALRITASNTLHSHVLEKFSNSATIDTVVKTYNIINR